ncbi:MAG: DUF4345 domain-containing protein [Mycobacteriaceae bacterium]|nr:DUF4345 domain-containing protein [Mycobacteriaceae bacterium]
MATLFRLATLAMDVVSVLIGVYHFLLGQWSIPGAGPLNPTIDSRERFFAALFIGFGALWIWAARQTPIPVRLVRALSLVVLLQAAGRVISVVAAGWPHWLQTGEAGIELLLPIMFWWLSSADQGDRPPAHL